MAQAVKANGKRDAVIQATEEDFFDAEQHAFEDAKGLREQKAQGIFPRVSEEQTPGVNTSTLPHSSRA